MWGELMKTNPTEAMKLAAVSTSEHLMETALPLYQPVSYVNAQHLCIRSQQRLM